MSGTTAPPGIAPSGPIVGPYDLPPTAELGRLLSSNGVEEKNLDAVMALVKKPAELLTSLKALSEDELRAACEELNASVEPKWHHRPPVQAEKSSSPLGTIGMLAGALGGVAIMNHLKPKTGMAWTTGLVMTGVAMLGLQALGNKIGS